jgi:hypothetical protein
MSMFKTLTAKSIKKYLEKNGIRCGKTSEVQEVEDGEVEIDTTTHIQVGETYMMLVQEKEGVFHFSAPRTKLTEILQDLRDKEYWAKLEAQNKGRVPYPENDHGDTGAHFA